MAILKIMNMLRIFLVFFFQIKKIKGRSEEFKECVNQDKKVDSVYDCTSITIPDSEGYKCCAMKITFNKNSSYSCVALENKYTTNKKVLNEYMSKNDISFLFASVGGTVEIDCGEELKISENYKKLSDEYLNCYNNHIKAIENDNNCTQNDIPSNEGSKCCFVETSTKSENGNIINDKRCYIIQDEYFTTNKNLNNYLLDESNNNLDEYRKTNITITCKNYETFFYSGSDKSQNPLDTIEKTEIIDTSQTSEDIIRSPSSSSGLKAWAIFLIVLGSFIFVAGIIVTILCCLRKRKIPENNTTVIVGIQNDSNNIK